MPSEAMAKDTTFTMRMDSETKEQWKELADEKGFTGLSDLVSFAVTQVELGNIGPSGGSEDSIDLSAIPEDLETRLKRIETKVDSANEDLDTVKREVTTGGLGNLSQPARDVIISQIPSGEGPSDGVTPEVIAQNLGTEVGPVATSLERIEQQMSLVKRSDGDGEYARYWKED